MSEFTRRAFLRLTAALGAAACGSDEEPSGAVGKTGAGDGGTPYPDGAAPADAATKSTVPGIDLDAVALAPSDFPYAVMAGDATPSSVILWTRYTGSGDLFVQLEAEGAPKGEAILSRPVRAEEKGDGGFVHVEADGLSPGARYRYAFFVQAGDTATGRTPLGSVRAAIAADALEPVVFGGTSCSHQNAAPLPILSDAAKLKVDFFLHAGDHVYCDAGTAAVTLAEYRGKYASTWGTAGLRALHASTGMVLTWDDHEFANNWNPETFPAARLAAAKQAYFEHRAQRRDTTAPDRVWRSLVWGKTLEMIVLDARSERKPSTRETAAAQFITKAQLDWLKDRLKNSPAMFRLVMTSVPISNFPLDAAGEADKWEGYAAQRTELLDYVETNAIPGVIWLSGDLHFGSVGSVGTTAGRMKMKEVLMGPAGSDPGNPTLPSPQFEKAINQLNYTVFRADPATRTLAVEFFGAKGSIYKTSIKV